VRERVREGEGEIASGVEAVRATCARRTDVQKTPGEGADVASRFFVSGDRPPDPFVVGWDRQWQYPAITERHAFEKAREFLPRDERCAYFGFPWATLIDQLNTGADAGELMLALEAAADLLSAWPVVATVCQHVYFFKYLELFEAAGVSHVFWSHTSTDTAVTLQQLRSELVVVPFPLYPVRYPQLNHAHARDDAYLYSFVGAQPSAAYRTQSRGWIFESLSDDPAALIVQRPEWHFQQVVYEQQIARAEAVELRATSEHAREFVEALDRSVFTLCPSGSGPNSIRLWEAMMASSIPVLIADGLLLPGNQAIWEEAIVRIPEDEESVRAIPDTLRDLVLEGDCDRKRHHLNQLAYLYGPDFFVPDIVNLFLDATGSTA
jgi:hypothetical protein